MLAVKEAVPDLVAVLITERRFTKDLMVAVIILTVMAIRLTYLGRNAGAKSLTESDQHQVSGRSIAI